MTLTDNMRRFMVDVDASPFDVLFQDHTATTRGMCQSQGYVVQRLDGTWSITAKGAAALAVDA